MTRRRIRHAPRLVAIALAVGVLTGLMTLLPSATSATSATTGKSPLRLEAVTPTHRSHTVHSDQAIVLRVANGAQEATELDADSVDISVTDLTDEKQLRDITWTVRDGRIETNELSLAEGHRYEVVATGSDRLGAETAPLEFTFTHLGVRFDQGKGTTVKTVEAKPVTETVDALTGLKVLEYRDVPMHLSAFELELVGHLAHGGIGFVAQEVDLGALVAEHVGLPASAALVEPRKVTVYQQVSAVDTLISRTRLAAAELKVALTSLKVTVPTAVPAPTMELAGVTRASLPTCRSDAGCAATSYATTDPLPFWFSDAETAELLERDAFAEKRAAEAFAAEAGVSLCTDLVDVGTGCYAAKSVTAVVRTKLLWDKVNLAWGPYSPADIPGAPVAYARSYPFYPPALFDEICSQFRCSSPRSGHDEIYTYCPGDEATMTSRRCEQTFTLKGYIRNAACTFCNEPPVDSWSIQSQGYFSWGVHDGAYDEVVWGMREHQSPLFVPSRSYSGHDYNWATLDANNICTGFYDTGGSDWVRVGNGLWGRPEWFGGQHPSLKQWTREYFPCGRGELEKNRLFHGIIGVMFCFRTYPCDLSTEDRFRWNYRGDITHNVMFGYGHNSTGTRWTFGCGPGFGLPPSAGVGCGWSAEADERKVWEAETTMSFTG